MIKTLEDKIKLLDLPNDTFTMKELKQMYRKKVMQFHPDKAQGEKQKAEYTQILKEINEAYEYLKNYLAQHNNDSIGTDNNYDDYDDFDKLNEALNNFNETIDNLNEILRNLNLNFSPNIDNIKDIIIEQNYTYTINLETGDIIKEEKATPQKVQEDKTEECEHHQSEETTKTSEEIEKEIQDQISKITKSLTENVLIKFIINLLKKQQGESYLKYVFRILLYTLIAIIIEIIFFAITAP